MAKETSGTVKIAALVSKWTPKKVTVPQRIVDFLLEVRKVAPGVAVPYNVIARAVLGLPTTPSRKSDRTLMVQRATRRAREIVRDSHKLSIHSEPRIGARLTVDDDDAVETRAKAAAARVVSATNTLIAEATLIDVSKVKNDANRTWFKREVVSTVRLLSAEDRLTKLLPPKKTEST